MKRTTKRFGTLFCACAMATAAAFAIGLQAKNAPTVSAEGITPKGTAVGTLGTDGLYQTTMTQIAPVNGVAASVENVYFEGFGEGTFFLTQFEGKNAPNFAIRATEAYSVWNGETAASAGLTLSLSSEKIDGYEAEVMSVSNGLKTSSRHSASSWEPYQTKEAGKGVGVDYLSDDQTYVLIVGANGNGNANVACWGEYYLFTLTDGDLELVNQSTGSFYTAAAAGDKAVIYPSIGEDTTKKISFKYSAPANSVGKLVDSLSVSYKDQLKEELGGGLSFASLNRIEAASARSFDATNVEYIEMDMASSELGSTTWILTDFVGGNIPNIAFGASGGLSTWTAGHSNDQNGTGMIWAQSYYHPAATHHKPKLLTGTVWNSKAEGSENLSLTKINNNVKNERFIQIIGATIQNGADTVVIKTYKVTSAGVLELYNDQTLSGSATNLNHGKLVLYGNINDRACGGSCTYALYNPSAISFRYSKPAASVEALIQGLGGEYAYKTMLADALGVDMASVTVKNEAGATVKTEAVYGNYALPVSNAKGFIGYEYGGKLYGAGSVLNVTSDIVVNEVTLDLQMTAGARIRAKEEGGHYGGLRFETTVSVAKLAAWQDSITLYGVVIPTEKIDGEFDVDEEGSQKVALVNYLAGETKNTYYITLTDVYYYNYNREFSARAYAEVTYEDGTTAAVALTDYSAENNSRSVYGVAKAALADTEYGYTAEQIQFIQGYVDYVVDLKIVNGELTALGENAAYEITKGQDEKYTVTVKNAPARIANAGYIPVTVWEEAEGQLVKVRTVTVAATLVDGNLISESFS